MIMSLLFIVGIHLGIKLNQVFFPPCGTITIHVQPYLIYSLVKRKIHLYTHWLMEENYACLTEGQSSTRGENTETLG